MPQKVEHTVHILEGKATLSIRKTSPHWQVRYKVGNKWLRTTTKEEDLAKAKSKAVDLVTNAWFRERNNLPTVSKRFRTIANLAIKRMDDEIAAGQGKATYKSYKNLSAQAAYIPGGQGYGNVLFMWGKWTFK